MHFIYQIWNTINNKIYIGQTKDLVRRWRQYNYYTANPEKDGQQYIHRAMTKYGIEKFNMEVLATTLTQHEANVVEERLIAILQSNIEEHGYNLKSGGLYNRHSPLSRKKMSESAKGRTISPETSAKMIATRKANGYKVSDETKAKISAGLTGRRLSPEHIQKLTDMRQNISDEHRKNLSESHKGKSTGPMSEETKKKLSEANKGKPGPNKGKPMPENVKAKLAEANIGRKLSDEHKQKLSEAHKGKTASEETRKKMSEIGKVRIFTDEHRKRISEAKKGIPGQKQSEETIKKRAASIKETLRKKRGAQKK